ncbi:hypothetical protein HBH98_099100 [Parastagonospora nodorum]|nr:hypothetical protein HBH53_060980 [Parastagonospora nodorum]KAH3975282.1 hypothetical protein HBH52_125870 [Parastagonospora nodorum]KAH4067760.1 hypothetical protein HBH50_131370 [Parastagonospora nodorum]KAH4081259.1 hypothetical protein HBH46_227390 [Parastagonospora nodorum]KAH4086859.1 hypothetical protein HBH48_140790 [Parastagonospora nodorum]
MCEYVQSGRDRDEEQRLCLSCICLHLRTSNSTCSASNLPSLNMSTHQKQHNEVEKSVSKKLIHMHTIV